MSQRHPERTRSESIRVRGLVQGVGFRPAVWRLACVCGLVGEVLNDGEGVLIRARASPEQLDTFCARLPLESPPLARIASIRRERLEEAALRDCCDFRIIASASGAVSTGVAPDAALCDACAAELADPANRRYRYPFINCTHCGPRLSIVRAIPYDRATTSMAEFVLCPACAREYADPADRRFHAQPNACPVCGPQLWMTDASGARLDPERAGARDALELASRWLAEGRILAIKGIGGFHLACDAASEVAVTELRRRKRRAAKPLALMARDLEVVRRWCQCAAQDAEQLASAAAPILLLDWRSDAPPLASGVAPGQATLGMMLPYSPLHRLLLADWERPLVMTSANRADEPPCIENAEALERLAGLADGFLLHDRAILNRLDDSVMRPMDGAPRFLRRARGAAPAPLALPPGFEQLRPGLALGGELKGCFALARGGEAILSQHLGDLDETLSALDYRRALDLYGRLFAHRPQWLVVDAHPDYHSTQLGEDWAAREGLALQRVWHHHAHIASVLADQGWPLAAGPVLGLAFDGLGLGADGTLWGGEWLRADYGSAERLAALRPLPMPGGTRAILEPWRLLYAQLEAAGGWDGYARRFAGLALFKTLAARPLEPLRLMLARGFNAPLTSSIGRLFDAVGAALGLGGERIGYEGQVAMELEALALRARAEQGPGYALMIERRTEAPWWLDPRTLWPALLADLAAGVEPARIAARFHRGLAQAVVELTCELCAREGLAQVALSGGVFQNRLLLEGVAAGLRAAGLEVLEHRRAPTNDGGLALGQLCVGALALDMLDR